MSDETALGLGSRHPLKMVAVHLGAGSAKFSEKSSEFAKIICEEVMLQQQNFKVKADHRIEDKSDASPECQCHIITSSQISAESAVVQLIQRMEDNQNLNCGFGSNLNIRGQAECDAGFMSDRTRIWSGVGALSGCRNPISLAKSLYDHQSISRPLGLVQPNMLVGSGAKQWMREHCPHLSVSDSELISSKTFSQYQVLKSRYDRSIRALRYRRDIGGAIDGSSTVSASYRHPDTHAVNDLSAMPNSSPNGDHSYCRSMVADNKFDEVIEWSRMESRIEEVTSIEENLETVSLDTVGAIAVDCDNNFVSAVSSGGLLLKYKGRIGQAAIPGAGCWSEDNTAASTTGVGEYLTTSLFAKKFSENIQTMRVLYDLNWLDLESINRMISRSVGKTFEYLMEQSILSHVARADRLAGILAVVSLNSKQLPSRSAKEDLYLTYGHNTETMCIGYMTCNDVVGYSIISRRGDCEKNANLPQINTIRLKVD